jgi:hypothetical protein
LRINTIALTTCTIVFATLAFARTADAEVYKCTEAGGKVLYADVPCRGGSVVDVRAGSADPAAIARLERQGAEFDRNMIARRAADEASAIQREALNAQLRQAEAAQRASEAAADMQTQYYGPAYFVAPRVKPPRSHRHSHAHQAPRAPRHNVPASPVPLPTLR